MATIVFDTYQYIKKLKAVGFTEEQAAVQAETIAGLINEQQLISINSRNAGDSIRWSTFYPLLEPVAPAKFIQFRVLSLHLFPFIESLRSAAAHSARVG